MTLGFEEAQDAVFCEILVLDVTTSSQMCNQQLILEDSQWFKEIRHANIMMGFKNIHNPNVFASSTSLS